MTEPSEPMDRVQRILEERARALAKPPAKRTEHGRVDVLVVRVGAESYGIGIEHVREVRPLEGLTPVPNLPPMWAGLVNLRGVLHPVLDMGRYLGLEAADGGEERQVVLVASATATVGLAVSEVVGLRSLPAAEIRPPVETDPDAAKGLVTGVTADMLLLLDGQALLGDPRLMVQEETA